MIRYSLSLFLLVLIALIVQQFLPAFTGLYNSRLLLVALVFLCGSVTIGPPVMLALAFTCGFLWDAQTALMPYAGDPEVYGDAVVEPMRFGYSIILYGVIGYLMQGIQPLFREGRWQFSMILVGVSIFVYQLAEYLLINFVRGDFIFTQATFLQITYTSILTMMLSPVVFWILFHLAELTGYQIRFDGLKKNQQRGNPERRRKLYP